MTRQPEITPVALLCLETRQFVDAELWDTINARNLADWESKWRPELCHLLDDLHYKGVEQTRWPQSRHWDWRAKIRALESCVDRQCFTIVCEDMTQAMMITDSAKRARIESQKNEHLVYIDFLESAPWNRNEIIDRPPRFAGCGSILVRAAIEYSKREEYKGRIGLHSLPQANNFYAGKVGMTDMGKDPDYQDLRYFEMTPAQAEAFIKEAE